MKSINTYLVDTGRKGEAGQAAAIFKSRHTYRGDTGRNGEASQAAAVTKSKLTYWGDTGRKGETGQAAAIIKSIITDPGDTRRKGEAGQAAAIFKSIITDPGDTRRKGEAGQVAAIFKSISTDDIIRCIIMIIGTITIINTIITISSLHYFRLREIQSHQLSVSALSNIVTSRHFAYETKISAINLTHNLKIGNLIFLCIPNLTWQSSCLFQFDSDLLCYQITISCMDCQATQQHKYCCYKQTF